MMGMTKQRLRTHRRRTTEEQIADLETELERLRRKAKGLDKFSPGAVKSDRERLELSAANYARLVGVSPLTIYSWESGRTTPQERQVKRWLAVRETPKTEAWNSLGIDEAQDGFSPDAVYAERERLELSARDYSDLVGVSHLTIYNWEHGRSKPRAKQLESWLAVKGIGKRKAWSKLGY